MIRQLRTATVCLGLLLGLVACGSTSLAPFQPEVRNATDNFQLQATDVQDVSTTLQYTWQNTGSVANVNHSTTTSVGSAQLVVASADGTIVYDHPLVPSLNERTASGAPGAWTVRVVLVNYRGTLNFRLQRP